ncbi:dimethylmenaquinone methyltransferase [Rhodobacteraceae bacterium KLH11]|nr:dimethylmenaquinone methyltransferase [Rhodobacteraceae bacterium KLH11]
MPALSLIEGLGVADVVDAMMLTHPHRAHVINLTSPDPERVLLGPAVTIGYLPVRKDFMDPDKHSLVPAIYRAVQHHDPKGAVLVMASNGHPQTSVGGGTKLSRVENLGMAGVICDGYLRDFEELGTYDFATYCYGEAVRAGGNEVQPYLADVPVNLGGVTVIPGDVIFARGSAAVVIPGAEAEEILKKARMVMEKMDLAKEAGKQEDPAKILAQGDNAI